MKLTKVLVVSDTQSHYDNVVELVNKLGDIVPIIHLEDGLEDLDYIKNSTYLKDVKSVWGNNDLHYLGHT